MLISIPSKRVQIVTSPKVASTALKLLAYRLENGRRFDPENREGRGGIHKVFPWRPRDFPDPDFLTIAIVRDPISRFVSGYRNRVVDQRELDPLAQILEEEGLDSSPTFESFVKNFKRYFSLSPTIRHHLSPQFLHVGWISQYDAAFSQENISAFERYLAESIGEHVSLGNAQRSKSKIPEVTAEIRDFLHEIYRVDYLEYRDLLA